MGAIEEACRDRGVPLAATAVRFSTRDPRIASTVIGTSRPERIEQTLALDATEVPDALWDDVDAIAARVDPAHLPAWSRRAVISKPSKPSKSSESDEEPHVRPPARPAVRLRPGGPRVPRPTARHESALHGPGDRHLRSGPRRRRGPTTRTPAWWPTPTRRSRRPTATTSRSWPRPTRRTSNWPGAL
ncbi:hypothetical protein [Streptomyces sp. NPDC088910]|uniref:hypothetical protein n=1 Tax=Streptomyces sp. NPDC088910 TaxID=3365911 RepID=UPI00382EF057